MWCDDEAVLSVFAVSVSCAWCEISSAAAAAGSAAQLTIAKSPALSTKTRTRKVAVQSRAELEEIEIEEMKKYIDTDCIVSVLLCQYYLFAGWHIFWHKKLRWVWYLFVRILLMDI